MAENGLNLPAWMRAHETGDCRPSGRAVKTSAVQKTIRSIATALQGSIFAERTAGREGLLQRIDPRVKIAGLVLMLVAASLAGSPYTLLLFYALLLFVAARSEISVAFFVKRVWFFIPLFAGIIVLPSIFNAVRPGDPLWTLWDFGREVQVGPWSLGTSLAITKQGLAGASMFIMRVAVSVSLAVLVALTTRWAELLKALRSFHVPAVFVLVLAMTYRYIHLLLGLAADMYVARESRIAGSSTPREDRRFAAASMGALLGKSQALSSDIYLAMLSRGYTGEPVISRRFRLRPVDAAVIMASLAAAAFLIGGDRVLG